MKIGFTELLIVFVVALFVIGPDKLPEFAKKLGESLAAFRKYSEEATKEIRESVVEPLKEAQQPIIDAMQPLQETVQEMKDNVKEVQSSISDLGKMPKAQKTKEDGETSNEINQTQEAEATAVSEQIKDSKVPAAKEQTQDSAAIAASEQTKECEASKQDASTDAMTDTSEV